MASNKGSHARGGNLANVTMPPKGKALGNKPTNSPSNMIEKKHIGQTLPNLSGVSTKKPRTRAALAFYGE